MFFNIYISYLSFTKLGNPTDNSIPRLKHWRLVISDASSSRIIELSIQDRKRITIQNNKIPKDLLPNLYLVADFIGDEEDFNRVIRHHPMQEGAPYSTIYNNCQHFVAMFLILLKALADETPGKSFKPQPLYITSVESVMSTDGEFLWNKPDLILELTDYGVQICAVASIPFATSVINVEVPVQDDEEGNRRPGATTTVAAPWASSAALIGGFCAAAGLFAVGVATVLMAKGKSWKMNTQIRHPMVYGFPQSPPLSPSRRP